MDIYHTAYGTGPNFFRKKELTDGHAGGTEGLQRLAPPGGHPHCLRKFERPAILGTYVCDRLDEAIRTKPKVVELYDKSTVPTVC